MNTVLVVLGNQVEQGGNIGSAHKRFCDSAADYVAEHGKESISIVMTGGYTTFGVSISEAAAGAMYLDKRIDELRVYGADRPLVWLEEDSCTTPENVRYTLELLASRDEHFDKLVIIGRTQQVSRVRAMLMAQAP